MVYRYIYKITCTAGSYKDKFYFGQHTTENLDDNYFASGKKILDYKKKYPNDYIREIIDYYNTEEELNKAEYDIIHPWLGNEMCLNIIEGGYHGRLSYETIKMIAEKNKGRTPWNKGKKMSEEYCRKNRESHLGQKPWNTGLSKSGFSGKHHSEEFKNQLSNRLKGKPQHKQSEETRKKISESLKAKKSDV